MRNFKRLIAGLLFLCMTFAMLPTGVFAAHDSTGRPLDLANGLCIALYLGTDFPGEPAEHSTSGYVTLNENFEVPGTVVNFATKAEGLLKEQILDDVVQGTSGVWGVFSTTGGSRYLDPASGLVNEDGSHNEETEQKIIKAAASRLGIDENETENYTIVWYIIKYQRSDALWHIDGKVIPKETFSVNYYGNSNTSGAAPTGMSGLHKGDTYTVLGNTGNLRKVVGGDTYIFNGWNTNNDGTGTHYNAGDVITIEGNVTLYAEWYLQNKYTITAVTKLDDVETNIENIHGAGSTVWVKSDAEDSEYIQLNKSITGTYTTTVTENGTYYVYIKDEQGNFEEAHGHQVIIFNQNGRTELLNYTVRYDENGGDWAEGDEPNVEIYHANHRVTAVSQIPVREGYIFAGWKDQDGETYQPGQIITEGILKPVVLTAQWKQNIKVTVNVTIRHSAQSGGTDTNADTMHNAQIQLLQAIDGVNLPYGSVLMLNKTSPTFQYHEDTKTTTYTYTFSNMPQGIYTASGIKSHYTEAVTRTGGSNEDQVINIDLTYAPDSFDLYFDVIVNFNQQTKGLMPKAVNLKVLAWSDDKDGNPGWLTITQQAGNAPPVTVMVDENGKGTGFYTVWRYWSGETEPYFYRVEVTSFVMPDGGIVPATGTGFITYVPDGSGLYRAVVTVKPDTDGSTGDVPKYPAGSNTKLDGAYFDSTTNKQSGRPTVTIDITPFQVTFIANDGLLNGADTLQLQGQFRYPDLTKYIPVPNDPNMVFAGWMDENGNLVTNLSGKYLTGDVTYYAKYSPPMTVRGEVTVSGIYTQDGKEYSVDEIDRARDIAVVLQKEINGVFNDVGLRYLHFDSIAGDAYSALYAFEDIPYDGLQYRIKILVLNYTTAYDNESDNDRIYTEEEYLAVLGGDDTAVVDAWLELEPDVYEQMMEVDASQISPNFRPTGALSELIYRDLGDIHPYYPILEHQQDPYGIHIGLAANGMGSSSYHVWQYHTDGTRYQYQMNVTKLYGSVENVFTPEGVEFNSDTAPYTIVYDPPSHFSAMMNGQARTLKATLIPKEYRIRFELNVGAGEEVLGMDQFLTDGVDGEDYYAYHHTWSYKADFTAFPYREGYVFDGWETTSEGVHINNHGYITVGEEVAEDVVLSAKWKKLDGTDYTVRHLELTTDRVLMGAEVVEGAAAGTVVKATVKALDIEGYRYAGALVNGTLYGIAEDPSMTVTNDPTQNVLTIYYVKEGYTDQVESNLHLSKSAILESNGTYTIRLETYTMDNPVTTMIRQNTPLDIVLVLDQSGSLAENQQTYLNALKTSVNSFVESIANHGRQNEVDHRIALVGFGSNETDGVSNENYPYSGGNKTTKWVNTGVFDSNGKFHTYDVQGFNYTQFTGRPEASGTYYVQDVSGRYMLLSHHDTYYHMITNEEARLETLNGTQIYGYVYDDAGIGRFEKLTRNSSGLWLYGDKKLYSANEFFTYHEDVWTHRFELERRKIHAYGSGANYVCVDGHDDLYTRTETTGNSYDLSIYEDALIPVSVGANGSGGVNPGLVESASSLGANGGTRVSYGIEMANAIFASNPSGDRVRIMLVFTDGNPGRSGFDATEANAAIELAYTTKNTHKAYCYTIGLYQSGDVHAESDIAYYMNGLSSNYPNAKSMDDVRTAADYYQVKDGARLGDGNTYYVDDNGTYRQISWYSSYWSSYWCYMKNGRTRTQISTQTNPTVSGGKIGNYTIYEYRSGGYKETDQDGYYQTTESAAHLKEYFENVMAEITTKITTKIILHEDTIMRDIMGQGLVLTPGTVITAYKQAGTYNPQTGKVEFHGDLIQVAQAKIQNNHGNTVYSSETTNMQYTLEDGTVVTKNNVPFISVYNLNAANATNPGKADYHPHTVDITGYDFDQWYIKEGHDGYKMVVTITRIEARDDVQWGRATSTNNEQSGLWLPADKNGKREILMAFEQPKTIFVERAYVLDYGKPFTLTGWYFDSEDGKVAIPIHVDCDIASGMNWFDPSNPNTANGIENVYGNTKYGNVTIQDGKVVYTPTTTCWGGYDEFYIFGNTWRKTVLAQDANENGNLWNKVIVIPANNVYYEDSFVTTEDTDVNGIEGFVFTGSWSVVYTDEDPANADKNEEIPEHQEDAPYGDVHGWTDSLEDDHQYTDGSAHGTGFDGKIGASVEFTFTGTGVDVYTRTNADSGMVVAALYQLVDVEDAEGKVVGQVFEQVDMIAMDNLAVSGDYYHIPTISFKNRVHDTYKVKLVATAAQTEGVKRYEYYVDGIRVYNPLGAIQTQASETIKDAYDQELNAVFTEVRDILLQYKDFNSDMEDGTDGKLGAVFIDWIQKDQAAGNDPVGNGKATYEVGTFQKYGPKNEVYLSAGQALVLKVDPNNTYFVGLKSLTGKAVTANVSGITLADPTQIELSHTTDLYYRVTPVNGYIVIQNGSKDGAILSVTNLRTTNLYEPVDGVGVLQIQADEAVEFMSVFTKMLHEEEELIPQPEEPLTLPQQQAAKVEALGAALFEDVRTWLAQN